jgi:uncharacterized protein YyaL (SSP411 family)
VPHFEKMLYDQAQLVLAFLEAAQVSGDPFFAQVAEDTLRYVQRDLLSPDGGFYSAEDADSIPPALAGDERARPSEGAFYTWTRDEIVRELGSDSRVWELRFGVLPGGNAPFDPQNEFVKLNLLYTAKTIAAISAELGVPPQSVGEALARGRQRLFAARATRPRPQLDDKVLTAWNGLMIAACARAARVLAPAGSLGGELAGTGAHHLAVAQRSAAFVRDHLWDAPSGRLRRRFAGGEAGIDGYAEDYAYLAWGLIELFQADGDAGWLDWARVLHARLDALFADPAGGWFATTGEDPTVLLRMTDEYDGAEPAASSVAVMNLLTLARLTGEREYRERAETTLAAWGPRLASQPRVAPFMLAAFSASAMPPAEIVVSAGDDLAGSAAMLDVLASRFLPSAATIPASAATAAQLHQALPWVAPLIPKDGRATAYVCRDFSCEQPVTSPEALAALVDTLSGPGTGDAGAGQ